ncbi:MAG: PfaD family polyunsaturated fatty acid/polyketide biosynthesis protein [Desulfobacteraceae bacterium]|nr:PfaD family polyunsaturated fatty acid/polyketide biosynthesis protein [Desulfobacteraceae bacterium]
METPSSLQSLLLNVSTPLIALEKDNQLTFQAFDNDLSKMSSLKEQGYTLKAMVPGLAIETLGDNGFKIRHGLKYPYIAGAMANGITSARMVKAMVENGMTAFLGAGGLTLSKIEENIIDLKDTLKNKPFGFNLIHSLGDPDHELATVELYLKHKIRRISAAAFMRMTLPLVYYRVKGIYEDAKKKIITPNHIIAKVSRVEVARQFFSPPPEKLINQLLEKKWITPQEAHLSKQIPMAQDLTAEADSGGHTDNRPALTLLPTMMALKNEFMETHGYNEPLCVGLAGGIATPESAAAAFGMGAAYILTGSINQSCIEADICEDVRKLLCEAQQADVAMAPAADMFEIGARVQVLKRGTMFPVRAEKLYKYYKAHNSYDEIDPKAKKEIEDKFLQASFDDTWHSTEDFFKKSGNLKELERAYDDPKHKMSLIFRSYLGLSSKWAIAGDPKRKMDYQIWCGPAIGAFNQWVKYTHLAHYKNRKVAEIALNLLLGAAFCTRVSYLKNQGIDTDTREMVFKPLLKERLSECIKTKSNL